MKQLVKLGTRSLSLGLLVGLVSSATFAERLPWRSGEIDWINRGFVAIYGPTGAEHQKTLKKLAEAGRFDLPAASHQAFAHPVGQFEKALLRKSGLKLELGKEPVYSHMLTALMLHAGTAQGTLSRIRPTRSPLTVQFVSSTHEPLTAAETRLNAPDEDEVVNPKVLTDLADVLAAIDELELDPAHAARIKNEVSRMGASAFTIFNQALPVVTENSKQIVILSNSGEIARYENADALTPEIIQNAAKVHMHPTAFPAFMQKFNPNLQTKSADSQLPHIQRFWEMGGKRISLNNQGSDLFQIVDGLNRASLKFCEPA